MSLTTSNKFGKISISDEAIQTIAARAALDCYGAADLVSRRFTDNLGQLFNKNSSGKGVIVQTVDSFIYIEIFAVLNTGVNVEAVKKSLSDAVKFSVETFTGMRVKRVHVNVVGIRVNN